ncbi:MAG TPA: pilin [Candidatus Baltobacteraceae bacterium]|nr:pilin [Candidatus Baltobacteraceae bacterium]
MRRLLLPVLFVASLCAGVLLWGVPGARATKPDKIPCYCRYVDASRLRDSLEKLYCPGEVGYIGLIDNSFSQASEILECANLCGANGWASVGPSALDDEGYGNGANMTKAETDYCVFSHYDDLGPTNSDHVDGWTSNYKDCQAPLNSIGKTETPQVCSFCYCKFKSTSGECAGKFSMVHVTGAPDNCPALCTALDMESVGPAIDDYSRCDYKLTDKCAKPINPTSPGCQNETANAANLKGTVTSRGSIVTLPLPLSNVSISGVIGRILSAVLGVVGAIALLMFVWGGFQWMMAAGSTEKVAKAKKTLVWAALGLVAIFSSYAVLNFVINALTSTP